MKANSRKIGYLGGIGFPINEPAGNKKDQNHGINHQEITEMF